MALKLPSVNAITRTISPSHGLFYSFDSHADDKNTANQPVKLQEVSLVGTLGSWKEGVEAQKKQAADKEQAVSSNIQTVDTCFLPPEHNAYALKFNLRIASLVGDAISNDKAVLAKFRQFVNDYRDEVGGEKLARRYLTNLINGRFLWRNKYADERTITIRMGDLSHQFEIDLNFDFSSKFTDTKAQEMFDKLVERTAQALFYKDKVAVIYITATGVIGDGQEIYPSQEFVNDKNETKSKVLFDVLSNNTRVAAFHSQKIGNAIRTIDTWYSNDATHAIPVDPFGPDKKNQTLHRAGVRATDNSIYSIFNRLLDEKKTVEPDSNDGHYLMACFIRGGVYAGK
jgi:CRISPR-associated protein Csy3